MDGHCDNVVCTACGCVCDDLRLLIKDDQITQVEPPCPLAEKWFQTLTGCRPPLAAIQGQPANLEQALDHAAALLRAARSPLIYGLSRSSTEGQRAAVALADRVGATIDTTASLGHAPAILAFQQVGESTCTLGEVKNRADLIIYWGSDPVESHPRHLERYSAFARGEFVPCGRTDRTLVVVDVRPTPTSRLADLFIQVDPGSDFEVLWALRALVRGCEREVDRFPRPAGLLRELVERMKKCRCGVVFFGLGLSRSGLGHRTVEALLSLVTDLNAHTRFYARRMRVSGDVAGADSVLAWQTGYPFSVNLARGFPRYNPGEFTAPRMLECSECDLCLLVGTAGLRRFSARATAELARIPTVVLDPPSGRCPFPATVHFTTSINGFHRPGTAYRMDEVPIPLRQVIPSSYPGDEVILQAVLERIGPTELPHFTQPSWPYLSP